MTAIQRLTVGYPRACDCKKELQSGCRVPSTAHRHMGYLPGTLGSRERLCC